MSVLIIWVLTGVLVYMAAYRLVDQSYDIDADAMIIVSGVGVAMNVAMGAVLHGGLCSKLGLVHHGHSHGGGAGHAHSAGHDHAHAHSTGHGHSHSVPIASLLFFFLCGAIRMDRWTFFFSTEQGDAGRNMNVRAALIHVVGDLVQSVGVLIAALIIKYRPDLRLADPICTFLFSGLVMATTTGLVRDVLRILMEGTPFAGRPVRCVFVCVVLDRVVPCWFFVLT